MRLERWMALVAVAWLGACSDARSHATANCILVDTSGTYVDQLDDVVRVIQRGILPKARPGDSVILITIDDRSYEKENLVASVTFDAQPSRANAEKLRLARQLDEFAKQRKRARYTDISGAMMLAGEYVRETRAGSQNLVVFSDMREELPRGAERQLEATELAGMRVYAMNVKKLDPDNRDPAVYRQRLDAWRDRVLAAGAQEFNVVLDAERLVEALYAGR